MPEFSTFEWVVIGISITGILVAVIVPVSLHVASERRQGQREGLVPRPRPYRHTEYPTIHATSGVPTLHMLTAGMALDAKKQGIAESLYESGLAQFNHYVNNRDGVIQESCRAMESLANQLSPPEISLAESVGYSLAVANDEEQRAAAEAQYELLSPYAQTYARHKQRELDAQRRIARDLERNVPRTDYTSVKARIASGNTRLDSILSELPIFWQDIRTLNDMVERRKITRKPPRQEFYHVMFMTQERGLLEDKRAEKDGDWIVSAEHDIMVPYQDPVPRCAIVGEGMPLAYEGEVIIVNQDPSSEWDTKFWRQRGRLDQLYLRAKNGLEPEQLRRAYRRRQINRIAWAFAGSILVVDIMLVIAKLL